MFSLYSNPIFEEVEGGENIISVNNSKLQPFFYQNKNVYIHNPVLRPLTQHKNKTKHSLKADLLHNQGGNTNNISLS